MVGRIWTNPFPRIKPYIFIRGGVTSNPDGTAVVWNYTNIAMEIVVYQRTIHGVKAAVDHVLRRG